MFRNGQGVTQDYKTALKWYARVAKQGDALAQYNLGVMYEDGLVYDWFIHHGISFFSHRPAFR